MKKVLIVLLLTSIFIQQGLSNDTETKIKILKAVFVNSELVSFKGIKVLETKVRGKYASIPIDDTDSKVLKFSNGIAVLVFNLYLSEKKDDYRRMHEEEIYAGWDVEEGSGLESINTNERFIQVIFFDLNTNKFMGKPDGFPIEGLPWIPQGMGDLAEFASIKESFPIQGGKNSCILQLYECPDCFDNTFCFKYLDGNVLASERYKSCLTNFHEQSNKIVCTEIINCYEYEYEDAVPENKYVEMLRW